MNYTEYEEKRIKELEDVIKINGKTKFLIYALIQLEWEYMTTPKKHDTVKTRENLLRMISSTMYNLRLNLNQESKIERKEV